jgi:hypothetical protein
MPTSLRLRDSSIFAVMLLAASLPAWAVDMPWIQPTAEELSMTSQPEVPGAAAVYLNRDEKTIDADHSYSIYVRLKVLTEKGKDYANVSLEYGSDSDGFSYSIQDLAGRTIHSDGSVIPFTGKPYQRLITKAQGSKVMEKVFSLPDVEVGSILEYRYKLQFEGEWLLSPTWYVQQDLFMRKGHFLWQATGDQVQDAARGKLSTGISWSSVLPSGAEIKRTKPKGFLADENGNNFELEVNDILPAPDEDYMPPIQSFTYRVNFYYAIDKSADEFWKNEGAAWAKGVEEFLAPPKKMQSVVETLVAANDTDTVKLQKIYAAIMAMDNTRFSRQRESSEDRAAGLKEIKTTQDIWKRKSGTDDQLTDLFVTLARAAGLKAYVMKVTSRKSNIFSPDWLTLSQLDDNLAIVVLDGQEKFFDPGQRYCPFGQVAWIHTGVEGLRETDGGKTAIASTPLPPYINSQTQRVADVTMDASGAAVGTVKITWLGAPALEWRQQALREDEGAMKRAMREWLEGIIPGGLEPEITTVQNLDDYEKPLIANFNVHGPLATVTAKRLILPGEFFEANSKPLFPHPTRSIAIYFEYAGRVVDAARVKFPEDMQPELVPKEDSFTLQRLAGYHDTAEVQPNWVLMRRTYDLGTVFFLPKDYADVRSFYSKLAEADQQPIVLLTAGAAAKSGNGQNH